MALKRYDIINYLIQKYSLKSYLEIGVQNKATCFDKIQCKFKDSVDPDIKACATYCQTSDDFFKEAFDTSISFQQPKWDLIFIDGLHEAEQVKRDIANALKCLSMTGFIVVHDCNPTSEEMATWPRDAKEWCGTTYKGFIHFRAERHLRMHVIDTDYGCGIIEKSSQLPMVPAKELTYEYFDRHRKELLNLITEVEFKQLY